MASSSSTTCCKGEGNKSGNDCICASQATCSCGQQKALACTCGKAEVENVIQGARCSCRARPAGSCTCARAEEENRVPEGEVCACGVRPADACTCEKASSSSPSAAEPHLSTNETDFTTKKKD